VWTGLGKRLTNRRHKGVFALLKFRRKWFTSLVLTVGIGLVVSACGSGGQGSGGQSSSSGGGAAGGGSEKVIVVGTDAAYPPFEKMEADKITGFDIDVIQAVADAAGLKIEVKNTGWDPLFDGLEKGTVDVGISAITITDKRKEKYDFSEPYFEANQLILVAEDSPVAKLADLKGKKIGVQSATTGEEVVKKAFGDTYEGIKGYDDTPSAVDDFFNGRVDAVVADNGVLTFYAKNMTGKKYKLLKDDSFEKEFYGIMVKKGNTELLNKINQGLKTIKDNGKLQEIHNKYFGQ
jgi:glutamine transport system substrate-binding protein